LDTRCPGGSRTHLLLL